MLLSWNIISSSCWQLMFSLGKLLIICSIESEVAASWGQCHLDGGVEESLVLLM